MPLAESPSIATAPSALPIVGHVPEFLRDRLGFLTRCAATGAAVVRLRLDSVAYLLNDPGDIKHVLENNYPNYDKTPRLTSARGRKLSGEGLLTSVGEEHLAKRRMLQPVFSANHVAPFAGVMVSVAEEIMNDWRDGQEIDIADAMMDMAQCVNGRILFDADYRDADHDLGEAIRIRRQYMNEVFASLLPFPEYLPKRINRAYRQAEKLIDERMYRLIADRRAQSRVDMLSMLIAARYADGNAMPDVQVRDEVVTAAITGYETIGEGLAWACYLVSQHPDVERALLDEVRTELGDRAPALGDVPKLRYTEMTLAESMRLFPPTWIYVRMARAADKLPSGVEISAGSKLYICPWTMHRSARQFPDPLRFDPQRFTDIARQGRSKYAHFPFGGGPRVCIGQALAKLQMALVFARLMQRFTMTLLPDQSVEPEPRITLRPKNGIRVRLSKRT